MLDADTGDELMHRLKMVSMNNAVKMTDQQTQLNVGLMSLAGKKDSDSIGVRIKYLDKYIEYMRTYLPMMKEESIKDRCIQSIKNMDEKKINLQLGGRNGR